MARSRILFAVVTISAGVVACGGSGETPAGPTRTDTSGAPGAVGQPSAGGTIAAGSGRLTIGLTDTPFSDAKAVLVTFTEVSVHRSGGGWEKVPFAGGATARTCDLKQLQGPTDVLGVTTLPAGHYTQVRLTVESAALYFENAAVTGPCAATIAAPDGESADLKIPSGTVKLNREFTVPSGGAVTMVLDFDGDRSIKQTGGGGGNGNGNGNGNGSGNGGNGGGKGPEYLMTPVVTVVSVQ